MTVPIATTRKLHVAEPRLETREWAAIYIARGLEPIPLLAGQKFTDVFGWRELHFAPERFRQDDNIGLKSTKGIRTTDLDCAEAVALADQFLPPTGAVWGRPSKPRSKRLYKCAGIEKTVVFKDARDGSMLLELRAEHQDMAPPSIHPDGERLAWSGDLLAPTEIPADVLRRAHALLATCALVARYYPPPGARHDWSLALAGFLRSLGLDQSETERVIENAGDLAHDPKVNDRLGEVRTTYQRGEEPTTGAAVLKRLNPDCHIVETLRRIWGASSELDEAIERLNEKFAIVSVGNKVVVLEEDEDGGSLRQFWPFEEFKKLRIKDRVRVGKRMVQAADEWLKHPRGRRYDRLIYDMPGSSVRCEPGDYNGFRGFTVKAAPGDWSKNRDHILRIVCNGDDERCRWLLNWSASLVQQPGRHAMTAVVLQGTQGTGKGHFADRLLGSLFYKQQYLHLLGAEQLTGRFNEHLSGKVLVFADESTWGGDPRAAERLKGLVTESTIPIERKYLPLVEEPSALHIIIASNSDWPVQIGKDDRRYSVFDVSDARRQDTHYFAELVEELRGGGLAAMLHELLEYKVDEHLLRRPLQTRAKADIATRSLRPIERWWFEKLQTGELLSDGQGWPNEVQKSILHSDLLHYYADHRLDGRAARATQVELGSFLKKFAPTVSQTRIAFEGAPFRIRVWQLPALAECRDSWLAAMDWGPYSWDED